MRTIIGTVVLLLASPVWIPLWVIGYVWRCAGEVWLRMGGEP